MSWRRLLPGEDPGQDLLLLMLTFQPIGSQLQTHVKYMSVKHEDEAPPLRPRVPRLDPDPEALLDLMTCWHRRRFILLSYMFGNRGNLNRVCLAFVVSSTEHNHSPFVTGS